MCEGDRRTAIQIEGDYCPFSGGHGCGMEDLEAQVIATGGNLKIFADSILTNEGGTVVTIGTAFNLPENYPRGRGVACPTFCVEGRGGPCRKKGGVLVYNHPPVE